MKNKKEENLTIGKNDKSECFVTLLVILVLRVLFWSFLSNKKYMNIKCNSQRLMNI